MKEPSIPCEALRPVVQKYLDAYETTPTVKLGNWKNSLSAVSILADEVGMPVRMLQHLLSGTYQTIGFDRADRLLCKMGYGVLGWLQTPALRDAYYSVNLAGYDA